VNIIPWKNKTSEGVAPTATEFRSEVNPGEKKETVEKTSQDVFHRETRYGSFSRTVQLPSSVDPQQVSAVYANGLLTVSLKKTPHATARKIPISTNAPAATP
jgi:hypothetical protein